MTDNKNTEINGIRINPDPYPSFFMPIEERSPAEIAEWWGRPFVQSNNDGQTYSVWSLNGGAHDRPCMISCSTLFATASEAADFALDYVGSVYEGYLTEEQESALSSVDCPSM